MSGTTCERLVSDGSNYTLVRRSIVKYHCVYLQVFISFCETSSSGKPSDNDSNCKQSRSSSSGDCIDEKSGKSTSGSPTVSTAGLTLLLRRDLLFWRGGRIGFKTIPPPAELAVSEEPHVNRVL